MKQIIDWRKPQRSNTQGGECVEVALMLADSSEKLLPAAIVGGFGEIG